MKRKSQTLGNNLSSIINLDSEFNFISDRQGDFVSDSKLSRVKSTQYVDFKMNSLKFNFTYNY
jgi:hypothetical protein